MYQETMMKMKPIIAIVLFSTQFHLGRGHLRHSPGTYKTSKAENLIEQSIEQFVEEDFFHISEEALPPNSSNTESRSIRRLQHPCEGQGETIDGIEIDCVVGSSVQRVLQFSVFHDSRKAETLYADASNPNDSAIGNVIFYDDADLHSVDMKSIRGRVQGTCTVVSTMQSEYCSFFYEIFADGKPDISFTAEGRVDNSNIEGSTLTISGGFNGLEDSSGIAILTPASLDLGTDPPRAVPDGHLFDGYLTQFQVQLNYDLASSRADEPANAPGSP
mmetsp:Transcript_11157/g.26889  ORF Transcript_11157/g.26889 Transcript_11157/m.26889 type:complete len:274 (+) Transcript_11157:26-847(+)